MAMAGIDMLPPSAGVPTVRRELVAGGYRGEIVVGGRLGILAEEWDATGGLDLDKANAWLTLAPCAPQGQGFARERSFYRPLTRFGRHGDTAALSGNPFTRPVLLAGTGAVFAPANGSLDNQRLFLGQGLTDVSTDHPAAVSQGYAPVLAIRLEVTA